MTSPDTPLSHPVTATRETCHLSCRLSGVLAFLARVTTG